MKKDTHQIKVLAVIEGKTHHEALGNFMKVLNDAEVVIEYLIQSEIDDDKHVKMKAKI